MREALVDRYESVVVVNNRVVTNLKVMSSKLKKAANLKPCPEI